MLTGIRYQPKPLKHGDRDTCTCPHCWTVFPYEDVLYVARHPELTGDPMLVGDVPSRFKPTRFTAEGQAIDPGGYPCLEMACPNCHLEVPKSISDFRSLFFSIIGMAQSGKSFFLTSMAWELRKTLSSHFAMSFTDLETSLNEKLHSYEETLFFPKDPDALVTLPKTEQQGELYNQVSFDGVPTLLPRPFLFTLKPQPQHPEADKGTKLSRTLILYDNAGEHFNPNQDTATQPGTMHMARSECLFFVFDPTQDPRFRAKLAGKADPQVEPGWHTRRQDICFNEAARRIRRHVGLAHGAKYRKQVVVVVNKLDLWQHLLKIEVKHDPFISDPRYPVRGLVTGYVDDVSFSVRALLYAVCPEVVTAVEDFAEHVTYIPVSTIGHSPVRGEGGGLFVRPRDVKPVWVTVPFLYAFAKLGLIYRGGRTYPDSVPKATLVGQMNGILMCGLPDGGRVDVPARLAGKMLHDPKTGRAFIVPTPGRSAAGGAGLLAAAEQAKAPPPVNGADVPTAASQQAGAAGAAMPPPLPKLG